MRILDSGKMLFLYHIAFFQWLPAHFLWFTSYYFIRFIVSYHLLSCQFSALQQLKLFLQVKSFWQAEITSFFHFYLHICFIFVVRNWWNTSSNLYKHFKFCFCLGYINLHYSHSYWVIRDFCHMSYHCFTVFDSTALFILASLFLCSLVFFFPALIYLYDWRTFTTRFNFLSFNSTRLLSILVLFSPFLTSETELSLLINPSFYSF